MTIRELKKGYSKNTIRATWKQKLKWFFFFEISSGKQAFKSGNSAMEKFRLVLEQLPDSIFILDKNLNFDYINPFFTQLSGYTKADVLNKNLIDFIYEDKIFESDTHLIETLRKGEKWQGELLTFHKTGNSYWANTIVTPYQDKSGNVEGYAVIQQNITEQYELKVELEESLHKFRELTEMLPQTVYEMDLEGTQTYLNQAGIKTFRYQASPVGRSAFDFILAEDHIRMKENMQKSITENNFTTGNEYTGVRDDGTQFPVIVYGAPIFNKNKVVGTRGIIIDISERKAMENSLRESEHKYKTLIENSQDGIFAIIGESIHFANNTLCEMLGYSLDEIYNLVAISLLVPDDHQRAGEIIQRRNRGDLSTVNEIFHFVTKDGSIKECDTFSSVLELNGQIVSYITVHDLTETRRMQEQLQLSEEKYRTVIDNVSDGIVITQQGNIVFSNRAMNEMMQVKEEDVVGKSFLNMVAKEDWQTMLDFHKRRMDGEIFTSLYRSNFIKTDGKIITMELNTRTSNYNGKPAAFIIMRDISERVRIENELQTARKNLEMLNLDLERRVKESSESLTEARIQVINLQKENLQSQFEVLKQQVNPHFLFNSLNVLTSLIKFEPDLAETFSEHLSKVYRYVLENKDHELVDMNTELIFLDAYIFLLKIRFVNKLIVNINIPESTRYYQVIPLAMQLLIENAIKHNTMSKSSPLHIDIFVDKQNFLNIVNNLQERPSQIISTGVGLKNIQNRYLLLNNTEPIFEKTETQFVAKVPLVIND